jgi:SRSO17 transposase
MTAADVRAAALQLVRFHGASAPLFGRLEAQDLAYSYLHGLMTCPGRKSVEPIALAVGHGKVSGLQEFINRAPWQPDDLRAEAQAVFAERLVPSADRWLIGTAASRTRPASPSGAGTAPAWRASIAAASARFSSSQIDRSHGSVR